MKYKYIINPKYESMAHFVEKLPAKYDEGGILIYNARNEVRVFKLNGEKIAAKRFRVSPFHQRIDYTFRRPSKAKRAYEYGLKLLELGISTPEPIACIEEYKYGLFRRGYVVFTYCGDPDARLLRDEWDSHDDLINAIAHFLVDMHEKGFLHGDVNLSNFLYREDPTSPTGYHITTIDINRSHFVTNPSREECLKTLMRITHVRPVMKKIVKRYAQIRGWDEDESYQYVKKELIAFEERKKLKKKMTGKK
ncbi:MAG: hypothetical protein IJP75_00515 [Bacteroidaceae bacterium]|nr:hypothetical protein [Bacteroidaceae bacterium]